MDKNFLLSVVVSNDSDEVFIHGDHAGLLKLQNSLSNLLKSLEKNECDHDHFISESWGIGDLTETMLSQEQKEQCKQIHQVKIYAWTEEWKNRHGL